MDKTDEKMKTFCPLPWTHISAGPEGKGRICCDGYEWLKNGSNNVLWRKSENLRSYFNSESYKRTRVKMLKGERPRHCFYCFQQEDHGVKSMRLQFIDQYKEDIESMISSTHPDGSIDHPQITYIDMALGNKCNLKCRMCSPWNSYAIGKDWQKMGLLFNESGAKKIFEDKWYASDNSLRMIKEALPHVRAIFTTGGEPMIIKEHLSLLRMIAKEGHAHHICLRYNSNQTVIPEEIIELWRPFQAVDFNCSVEAYGALNDYIRYPSKWEKLEKNLFFLDKLSSERRGLNVYIHTTLQAYNVIKIPEFLSWLRRADFKSVHRFPFFIWVRIPQWLSPALLPEKMRREAGDKILESLREHEEFFLNYNPEHRGWSSQRIQILKEFCGMIKNSEEPGLSEFVEQTKKHDSLRGQSILRVLPEFQPFFS